MTRSSRFLISTASALVLLASCSLFGNHPDSGTDADLLDVTIRALEDAPSSRAGAASAPRTVLPAVSAVVSGYSFSGDGPGDAAFELVSADPWLRTRLLPGLWSLTIRGVNDTGTTLLVGSASILIEPGSANDLSVALSPREGEGTVSVAFILPAETPAGTRIAVEMAPLGGGASDPRSVETPFAPLSFTAVPSGYYTFSARIEGGAGLSEALRVLPDTETALSVDFASVPGSATVSLAVSSGDPIAVRLPPWTHRAADVPLSLVASVDPASAQVAWRLDGVPVSGGALPAPHSLGLRRLDAIAALPGRGGSAGLLFEALSGVSVGAFRWHGTFSPEAAFTADLPTTHGFADVAVSSDGRVFALDAPAPGITASGNAARSTVHVFTLSAAAVPFQAGSLPVRSADTARSADRLVVSPDGAWLLAWDLSSYWLAFRGADTTNASLQFTHLDAAALGASGSPDVKDAVFSADSRYVYALLSGSPNRLSCLVVSSGVPSLRWSLPLDDPAFPATPSFPRLSVDAQGTLLLASESSDMAVLLASVPGETAVPEIRAVYRRTQGGPAWLDGPVSCAPAADSRGGGFLLLCAVSGTLARIGLDAGGGAFIESIAEGASELIGADLVRSSPDGSAFAVFGSESILLGSADTSFPAASLPRSPAVPALSSASSFVLPSAARILTADAEARLLSLFCP